MSILVSEIGSLALGNILTAPRSSGWSAATWIYPTSVAGWATLVGREAPSSGIDWEISFASGGANIHFFLPSGSVSLSLSVSAWHHIAGTIDYIRNVATLWVDGSAQRLSISTSDYGQNGAVNHVGYSPAWNGQDAGSRYRDLFLYRCALSGEEIAALRYARQIPRAEYLLEWLPFGSNSDFHSGKYKRWQKQNATYTVAADPPHVFAPTPLALQRRSFLQFVSAANGVPPAFPTGNMMRTGIGR